MAEMTAEERLLWEYMLDLHVGRRKAIKLRFVAQDLQITTRQLQRHIHSLVTNHNKPIASACDEPMGIYVPADNTEAQEAIKRIEHRRNEIAERARKLSVAWERHREPPRQQTLFDLQSDSRAI